jgi:hypothetical protein
MKDPAIRGSLLCMTNADRHWAAKTLGCGARRLELMNKELTMKNVITLVPDDAELYAIAKQACAEHLHLISNGNRFALSPVVPRWLARGAGRRQIQPAPERSMSARDHAQDDGQLLRPDTCMLHPSPTNPRKTFAEETPAGVGREHQTARHHAAHRRA